ncbi:uncharacterized protein LOC124927166 [Impatiens glandulifera]|uniref:uncharacterized protein LOC124927166 n=1 Tax=Impatiens glandulifera TaxID=253017 RepID=UPI001FB0C8BA|nr:uncharacterized protein LOC124927166 [Impatiens glandulifera]XP_047323485.1 uncharacterized protein LOC124927166 [Impatiens glandulifera]
MAYSAQRANWKDHELLKIFLDACIEVDTSRKNNGSAMKKQSWDIIGKTIKEKKGLTLSYKQLKNQWDYMKRKYSIWEKIVNKTGSVKWTPDEWDEYIKANPDAKQFRYAGLQYANEMKSLFDGTGATSSEGMLECDPMIPMIQMIDADVDLSNSPMSPPVQRSRPKRRKANTDESIDDCYKVLKTSKDLEEPSFEDCYKVLNELLDEGDPLYIVACAIFCENKMYKEAWMTLTKNSDYVRKNWLTMVGKRFGLIN